MAQASQQESLRTTTYRLQTTAYANRWGLPTSPTKTHIDNGRWDHTTPRHKDTLLRSRGHLNLKPTVDFLLNHEIMQRSKSLQQLSITDTDHITDSPQKIPVPSPHADFQEKTQSNTQKQSNNTHLSFVSSSTDTVANPANKSRPRTARLSITQAPVSTVNSHRRRRFSSEDDPTKVAMKISLPCIGGCCYCVFSALLGPVKVYITRADKPKKEPLLLRIKDGNGKPIIPVSRKTDVKGLVYDPVSFSLHPPVRGQGHVLQKRQRQRK